MKSNCLLKQNKYPWIVALIYTADDKHFCGGTLVASKYVISAAHCMWLNWAMTKPLKRTDFQVWRNSSKKLL